jgi:hypothetical protein
VSEGVVNTDDEDDGESRGDHHAKKKSTASVSAAFPMSRTPVNINLATADLSLAPREDTLPGTESLERRQENVPRVAGEEDTDLQDRPLSMFVWLAIVVMSIVAPWGLWRVYKNVLH